MLKLSVGKGRQVIKQLCCAAEYGGGRVLVHGVCALQSSSSNTSHTINNFSLAGVQLLIEGGFYYPRACARGKAIGLYVYCHRRRPHENRQISSSRRLCVL